MFSIVVATCNRAQMLVATLKSLLTQDISAPYEIIVVDNHSSDATPHLVRTMQEESLGKVRYVFEKTPGASVARNAGIAAARGEVIAFIDDDVVALPNWLAALVRTYQMHSDAWCVGGKITLQLPPVYPTWFDPTSRVLAGQLSFLDYGDGTIRIDYPNALTGANLSVRRDVLSRVGVFDSRLGPTGSRLLGGEDHDLCYRIQRAEGAVYYCGEAVVTHVVPKSRITKRYFRKKAYGHGRASAIIVPQDGLWEEVMRLGSNVMKDWAKVLRYYAVADVSRAFDHEVTAWVWLGRLQQILLCVQANRNARPRNRGL